MPETGHRKESFGKLRHSTRHPALKNSRGYQRTPQSVPQGNRKRALAEAFLRAVAAGDDGAVALAAALAESVLGAGEVKAAQSVLEGGPLAVTRAIRLAELILAGRSQAGKVGAL